MYYEQLQFDTYQDFYIPKAQESLVSRKQKYYWFLGRLKKAKLKHFLQRMNLEKVRIFILNELFHIFLIQRTYLKIYCTEYI